MRLLALEARAEAQLQLREHAAAVGELEALLVEQPSRERIAWLLMLGLYRCGRQADALAVYQRTRAYLAQELGLEPGPELAALQIAVLKRDQELLQLPAVSAPKAPAVARGNGSEGAPPVPATPFLGRQRELAAATRLLRHSRLLTMTGAGGSGKDAARVALG